MFLCIIYESLAGMAVYFIKYIYWEIVLFNYFRNVMSDSKATVLGISKFYLNVTMLFGRLFSMLLKC